MPINKALLSGSTAMLLLKLLEEGDKYGYQMMEALAQRSDQTFQLKAGTLYPLLHDLEKQGAIRSYEGLAEGKRLRRYYALTEAGKGLLQEKETEWEQFTRGVAQVLGHGMKGRDAYDFI